MAATDDLGIDGLEQVEMIGRGGFSTVYSARHALVRRSVAVKVLGRLDAEADRRRFERECEVMGRMSDHPNVVSIHHAGYARDGRPYVLMELVTGGTLADLLKREGSVGWERAVAMMAPVCDAVAKAHAEQILHRDIKPENILLDGDTPKLTDFGIARLRDATGATSTRITASWLHTPPETFENKRDERSDVYSIGSTLWTLIVGHPPFWRADDESLNPLMMRLVTEHAPRLPADAAPAALADLVASALSKDPAGRPASAAELAEGLRSILDGSPADTDLSAPDPSALTMAAPTVAAPAPPTTDSTPPVLSSPVSDPTIPAMAAAAATAVDATVAARPDDPAQEGAATIAAPVGPPGADVASADERAAIADRGASFDVVFVASGVLALVAVAAALLPSVYRVLIWTGSGLGVGVAGMMLGAGLGVLINGRQRPGAPGASLPLVLALAVGAAGGLYVVAWQRWEVIGVSTVLVNGLLPAMIAVAGGFVASEVVRRFELERQRGAVPAEAVALWAGATLFCGALLRPLGEVTWTITRSNQYEALLLLLLVPAGLLSLVTLRAGRNRPVAGYPESPTPQPASAAMSRSGVPVGLAWGAALAATVLIGALLTMVLVARINGLAAASALTQRLGWFLALLLAGAAVPVAIRLTGLTPRQRCGVGGLAAAPFVLVLWTAAGEPGGGLLLTVPVLFAAESGGLGGSDLVVPLLVFGAAAAWSTTMVAAVETIGVGSPGLRRLGTAVVVAGAASAYGAGTIVFDYSLADPVTRVTLTLLLAAALASAWGAVAKSTRVPTHDGPGHGVAMTSERGPGRP